MDTLKRLARLAGYIIVITSALGVAGAAGYWVLNAAFITEAEAAQAHDALRREVGEHFAIILDRLNRIEDKVDDRCLAKERK